MPTLKKHRKPWIPKPKKVSESWAYDERYHTQRWRNYRKTYLKQYPLCKMCRDAGKVTPTEIVDHIIPVSQGGDFWNPDNHQPLCKRCNNIKKNKDRKP